ncbi:MAG: hemerythrin family protein [Magnetococcales bacterium]|nr:hemerythrin family protein [Magnetococcales bacterium]
METLQWTDALSVGLAEIDNDHKKLVEMLNALIVASRDGSERIRIGKILDELISYTSWHFRHEERLMQTYRFKGFMAHKNEHAGLIEQAASLQKAFHANQAEITLEVLEFLRNWLTHHILETDLELGTFLKPKLSGASH